MVRHQSCSLPQQTAIILDFREREEGGTGNVKINLAHRYVIPCKLNKVEMYFNKN